MKDERTHHVGLAVALVGLISAVTLLGPARLVSAQAVYPSWSDTGRLNTGRVLHTMTLLPKGKVLIAGWHGLLVHHVHRESVAVWFRCDSQQRRLRSIDQLLNS